jgi:hypothetical protein
MSAGIQREARDAVPLRRIGEDGVDRSAGRERCEVGIDPNAGEEQQQEEPGPTSIVSRTSASTFTVRFSPGTGGSGLTAMDLIWLRRVSTPGWNGIVGKEGN